ncbi:hypothetical protein [Streptomyces sp. NPDC047841]|uniref:hypothetical protein n=1 Tax=Streptomyces sp. NPDC047841 TaxID=3154708 RepID=UPI00345135D3
MRRPRRGTHGTAPGCQATAGAPSPHPRGLGTGRPARSCPAVLPGVPCFTAHPDRLRLMNRDRLERAGGTRPDPDDSVRATVLHKTEQLREGQQAGHLDPAWDPVTGGPRCHGQAVRRAGHTRSGSGSVHPFGSEWIRRRGAFGSCPGASRVAGPRPIPEYGRGASRTAGCSRSAQPGAGTAPSASEVAVHPEDHAAAPARCRGVLPGRAPGRRGRRAPARTL